MKRDSVAARPKPRAKKNEYQHRAQNIRRLRLRGYLTNQIAEELGLSSASVNNVIHRLIQEGRLKPLPRGRKSLLLSKKERKEREDLIVKLREEGRSNTEIAEELGLSISRLCVVICKLIQKGRIVPWARGAKQLSKKEIKQRDDLIVALRREGYSNKEIAEELKISMVSLSQVLHGLIQKGRIIAWARGVSLFSEDECKEYENQVVILREQGKSTDEIAEELELSVSTVESIISYLLAQGRTKRKNEASWRNLSDERVQTIIKMVKTHATLQEIGNKLGLTKERARQLIGCIKDEHGEAIFSSDETIWTITEAASELGVNANIISCICRSGDIPTQRRGVNEDGIYLINEESMRMLRKHPLVTRERKCGVCDKAFTYERGSNKQVCSEACLKKRQYQQREACFDPDSTADVVWYKDLWQRLQTHVVPKNETWLTITEAKQQGGLSHMQLVWLRRRSIVTIRPDPVKRWHGQPVATYAASEIKLAGKLYKAWQQKQKTQD